jgi:hypothetical protein
MQRSLAWVSLALAAIARLLLAPLRMLSPDEAYYLCAARRGWPIVDHPPLLGWLLWTTDRLGSVELRVRLVAIALQAVTAIGIGVLSGPAFAWGVFLATWGLMSWVSGLIATPDAPLLAACVWLLVMRRAPLGVFACAFLAVTAKVSGLFFVLAVATTLRGRALVAALLGVALAAPFCHRSLVAQVAHALGRGGLVSAPFVGRPLALAAAFGSLLLYGPAVLYLAYRGRRRFDPAGARVVFVFAGLYLLSAAISGRPPEANWIAPAFLPLLVVAAIEGAAMERRSFVELVHVAPTVLAIALWVGPESKWLARVPREDRLRAPDLPPYALPAWSCIYDRQCQQIDAILRTSEFK